VGKPPLSHQFPGRLLTNLADQGDLRKAENTPVAFELPHITPSVGGAAGTPVKGSRNKNAACVSQTAPIFTSQLASYPPRFEAFGANIHALARATNNCTHALNIRVKTAVRAPVGVRNALPETGAFSADVTGGSHDSLLQVFF